MKPQLNYFAYYKQRYLIAFVSSTSTYTQTSNTLFQQSTYCMNHRIILYYTILNRTNQVEQLPFQLDIELDPISV